MNEPFEILSPIREVEIIAAGKSVRSRDALVGEYGRGKWKKMKGVALIRFIGGRMCEAEIHWYEAQGVGRFDFKVKQELS